MDFEDEELRALHRGNDIAILVEGLTIIGLCLGFIIWGTYHAIHDWPCWIDSAAQLPECQANK